MSVTGLSQTRAAEPVTSFTVLSPADVKTYSEIFAAEKSGQTAKADTLAGSLSDTSLLGYALEERYLGAHYHSKFSELKSWLEDYGDLLGADQIYKLAVKRAPKKTSVPVPLRPHWRGVDNEPAAFGDLGSQHQSAQHIAAQLRALQREDRPEAAEALWKRIATQSKMPDSETRPPRRLCCHGLSRPAQGPAGPIGLCKHYCKNHRHRPAMPLGGRTGVLPPRRFRKLRQTFRSGREQLERAQNLRCSSVLGGAQLYAD